MSISKTLLVYGRLLQRLALFNGICVPLTQCKYTLLMIKRSDLLCQDKNGKEMINQVFIHFL
jgi:hypothetical protein